MKIVSLGSISRSPIRKGGMAKKMMRGGGSSGKGSGRTVEASYTWTNSGNAVMTVRCLKSGLYKGRRGNRIFVVFSRLSSNRYAGQVFKQDGTQINGNVIDTGGIEGFVDDFNADNDLNSDFIAIFHSEVDAAFGGTGFANAEQLNGGRG
jgi:hypothetical protein